MNNKILWLAAFGTGSYLLYKAFSGKKSVKDKPKPKLKPIQPQRKAELDALQRGESITPQNLALDTGEDQLRF